MTSPQPWQLQHPPEKWQEILLQARAALHANPQDHEALEAIQDATEALNVYEEAAAAPGSERITSGVNEGLQGLGQAGLDVFRGIPQIPHALRHPIETLKNLSHLPEGLSSEQSPETVARTVGNIGGLLLPAAKMSGKVGLGAGLEAPTVASAVGKAAAAPFRAAGRSATALLRNPVLKSQLLEEQIALAAARRAAGEAGATRAAELHGPRLATAAARQGTAEAALGRQPILTSTAEARLGAAKGLEGRQPGLGENLELRNELLRRQLAGEDLPPTSAPETTPPAETPVQYPGETISPIGGKGFEVTGVRAPRPKPSGTPFDLEGAHALTRRLEAARAKEAVPQFEEGLPMMSPSRLIGPMASDAEIDALIKALLEAQVKGYK